MAHTFNLDTYTTFLTANGNRYSGVEAAKALHDTDAPAHDTISRFLADGTYTPSHLWRNGKWGQSRLFSCKHGLIFLRSTGTT